MKKFELNPIARKWVKALRSGKYKQTTGTLTQLDDKEKVIGHCCLGVLCELAVADKIIKKHSGKCHVTYDGKDDLLPEKVRKWVGLRTNNGGLDSLVEGVKNLASLNDYPKKSFKFIARVIEQKAKELFE